MQTAQVVGTGLHLKLSLLISDNVLACGGFFFYRRRVVGNYTVCFNWFVVTFLSSSILLQNCGSRCLGVILTFRITLLFAASAFRCYVKTSGSSVVAYFQNIRQPCVVCMWCVCVCVCVCVVCVWCMWCVCVVCVCVCVCGVCGVCMCVGCVCGGVWCLCMCVWGVCGVCVCVCVSHLNICRLTYGSRQDIALI